MRYSALHSTKNATATPDLEGKFAIEQDYIDKTFNEIGVETQTDDSLEAKMTKIAYDERNIYVMEYLQKVMDKENERADKPELSPELQSHQLHQ